MPRPLNRRQFLRSSLLIGAGVHLRWQPLLRAQTPPATPEATPESTSDSLLEEDMPLNLELTGAFHNIHDPVIIKAEDAYYLYCTGPAISIRRSLDLIDWKMPFPVSVFAHVPDWALEIIPGATNIWAPDISFYNDKYHLYYSVSTFGSNHSVIGLATNTTLDSKAEGYKWEDQGLVIESPPGGNYNCIDANLVIDADGNAWLTFGSFWSGIKMRRLDYNTGKLSDEDTTLYSLAQRFEASGSVEAPFIIHRGDFYYLFVSFDFCCRGADSTYRVMVGRSESVTGPYVDRDGRQMLNGGGTQVTFPTERWRGPGHCAVLRDGDVDYLVYHAYDAETRGTPTLRIDRLIWDDEGWCSVALPNE